MKKLRVLFTVRMGLRGASRQAAKLAAVLVIPFLLYQLVSAFLIDEFYDYLEEYLDFDIRIPLFMSFGDLVRWLADLGHAVEIVVLRLILLPAIAYSYLSFLAPSGRSQAIGTLETLGAAKRLFLIELLMSFLVYVPAIPVLSELTDFAFFLFRGQILLPAYFLVSVLVAARLCLAYPDIVLGRRWSIAGQWRRSRGNTFRLLAIAMVFITMAVGVLMFLKLMGFAGPWGVISFAPPSFLDSTSLFLLFAFFETVKTAAICSAYASLAGYPASGLPGGVLSSKELSEVFD